VTDRENLSKLLVRYFGIGSALHIQPAVFPDHIVRRILRPDLTMHFQREKIEPSRFAVTVLHTITLAQRVSYGFPFMRLRSLFFTEWSALTASEIYPPNFKTTFGRWPGADTGRHRLCPGDGCLTGAFYVHAHDGRILGAEYVDHLSGAYQAPVMHVPGGCLIGAR
jgi:hypothetical protein